MNKSEGIRQVTGKIHVTPNPLSFGQRCIVSWETNDSAGAEVRVSTGGNEEKLVARGGRSGEVEISWIADSTVYEFRLYPVSRPDLAIDSVKTRREIESAPAALRDIADEVRRGNIDTAAVSRFIASVMPFCLRSRERR